MTFRYSARPASLLLAPLLLALTGCGLGDDSSGKDAAAGQVLPGTISDAMVPLDTVRSQPPLAPPPGQAKPAGDASDAADAEGDPADAAAGDAAAGGNSSAPTAAPAPAAPAPAPAAAAKPAAE